MRRRSHNHLILLSVLFWVAAAWGLFAVVTQSGTAAELPPEQTGQMMARQYIDNALPVISRGITDRSAGEAENTNEENVPPETQQTEKAEINGYLLGIIEKTFPFLAADTAPNGDGLENEADSGTKVGESTQNQGAGTGADLVTGGGVETDPSQGNAVADAVVPPTEVPVLDTEESKKPLVLIYHTHATESYQPVSVGNFHSVPETGTVREVGNELTKALEAKGIPVLHDKTLHDNPSYNESYSRSLETVKNYLKKNPSIKIVIDLHRDAASYSGNVGKTTTVNGNKVATYSLVIGKGNANVDKLHQFANRINAEAEKQYPGLASRIIDKEYRFNQYVSDQHLLLEVGNNENTIDQVKLTGKYFADILEAYIKDYPQN